MVASLSRRLGQHELPVAIGTFDLGTGSHLEEHAWMPKSAAAAVTGDPVLVDNDDFGWRCRHGEKEAQSFEFGRIIPGETAAASADLACIASAHSFR
jgi:hypothetical protein